MITQMQNGNLTRRQIHRILKGELRAIKAVSQDTGFTQSYVSNWLAGRNDNPVIAEACERRAREISRKASAA